jgi:hypothetical protein
MGAIERFCDRAMLLDSGKVIDIGDSTSIARQYNELNFRRVRREAIEQGGPEVFRRPPVAELLTVGFESPSGERLVAALQGEPCCVRMDVRFHSNATNPLFSVALRNELGHIAFFTATSLRYGPTGEFHAGERVTVRVVFENWLGPGRYTLTASVNHDGPGADSYDTRPDITSIIIHATHAGGGVVDLPHSFEIVRE